MSSLPIPERLADNCTTAEQCEWLARLPDAIAAAAMAWALELAPPFDGPDVSAAWVARARRRDGTSCVLKIAMPHMEGAHEAAGLRHWNGDPTIRLLDADSTGGVMLLEACEPGISLRSQPELEQDTVVASLLRRAWQRALPIAHPFRPLGTMLDYWAAATRRVEPRSTDSGLVRAGLELFDELGQPAASDVLLMTDLHAGNVLAAKRESWLTIDPKPFVGDGAYDATQHLLNCIERVLAAPATIDRFAELLEVDARRVCAWLFARAAAEPRESRDAEAQMQGSRGDVVGSHPLTALFSRQPSADIQLNVPSLPPQDVFHYAPFRAGAVSPPARTEVFDVNQRTQHGFVLPISALPAASEWCVFMSMSLPRAITGTDPG